MTDPIVENDADLSLTLTRILDAPRDAVFRAWVDPAHIARWIGPRSIKAEVGNLPRAGTPRTAGRQLGLGGRGGPTVARDGCYNQLPGGRRQDRDDAAARMVREQRSSRQSRSRLVWVVRQARLGSGGRAGPGMSIRAIDR